jgi:putative ABC transport system permease protein
MFRWLSGLRVVVRSAIFRDRVEQELDEEMQYHLEQEINERLKAGLSEEEARYAALRTMGSISKSRDECRDIRGVRWVENVVLDLHYSLRSIKRSKGLALGVVVSMGLGLGVTASLFSLADFFVFRPLPVPETSRVVRIANSTPERLETAFSYLEYQDYVERNHSFSGIATYETPLVGLAASATQQPRMTLGMPVSGNLFSMLQVNPVIGRGFLPEEDSVPGRDAVAIITYNVWQKDFSGSTDVIGREVRINGYAFTVIGVAPKSFTGVEHYVQPDVYFPRMMIHPVLDSGANIVADRSTRSARLFARLKPGVTMTQANDDIARIARQLETDHPETNKDRKGRVFTQFGYRTADDPRLPRMAVMFLTLAAIVLGIATLNVSNLLLSAIPERMREMAVRTAMGAPRRRLLRQLLLESAILSSAGSVFGLAIAKWWDGLFFSMANLGGGLPVGFQTQVDHRVAIFTFSVGLSAAFLAGLIPAWRCSRTDLNSLLKSSDLRNKVQKTWGRQLLVGIQVAVASLFMLISGSLLRNLQIVATQSPGFRIDHVLLMSLDPSTAGYDVKKSHALYTNLIERIRSMPGVRSAALAQDKPFGGLNNVSTNLTIEGYELPPKQPSIQIRSAFVSPGYFETLAIPMIRGRAFDRRDDAGAPRTVIINQTMAERYWPNRDPIGVHVEIKGDDGGPAEVIGVARDVKYGDMNERPMDFLYRSYNQCSETYAALFVETNSNPEAMTSAVRGALQDVAPNVAVFDVRTMENQYRENGMAEMRMSTRLFTSLGLVALSLGILGLYGVISYSVGQRTYEIGIRLALGAPNRHVMRMVLLQGMRPSVIALAAGLGLALLLERITSGILVNRHPHDPVVYCGVFVLILFMTGIACYIPARRASIVDPNIALRDS